MGSSGQVNGHKQVWLEQGHVKPSSAPAEGGDAAEGDEVTDSGLKNATEDLGEMRDFGSGFYPAAGAVLDALLPNQGDLIEVLSGLELGEDVIVAGHGGLKSGTKVKVL